MPPAGQQSKRLPNSNSFYAEDTSLMNQLNSSLPLKHNQVETDLLLRTEKAINYLRELIRDLENTKKDLLNRSIDNKENTSFNLKQCNSSMEYGKKNSNFLYGTLKSTDKSLKAHLLQIIDIVTNLQKFSYLKTHTRLPSELSFANDFVPSKKSFTKTGKPKEVVNSMMLDFDLGNLGEDSQVENNLNHQNQGVKTRGSTTGFKSDETLLLAPENAFMPSTFVDDSIEGLFKEENRLFQDISPIHIPDNEAKFTQDFCYLTNIIKKARYEEKLNQIQNEEKIQDLQNSLKIQKNNVSKKDQEELSVEKKTFEQNEEEKDISTELSIEFEVAEIETEKIFTCSSLAKNCDMLLKDLDQGE